MLWEIQHSKLTKISYLFGTYHSRDKHINDLPDKVTHLLASTQTLYTETKLTNKSQKTIHEYMQTSHLSSLKSRLSSSVYTRLQAYIKNQQLPFSAQILSVYKTWAIALLITNHADSQTNTQHLFMDQQLVKSAQNLSIPSLGLETPQEQLIYFDQLTPDEQELLLIDSINQTQNTQYAKALKQWYMKGSLEGFRQLQDTFKDTDKKMQQLDTKLFSSLLTHRNIRFLKRIDLLLQKNPEKNYFFAVGAGHLAEENGLVELLKKSGYLLKKVQ